MDFLPFSPTFFSEIDIFQQLEEYEEENKPTWDAEKYVLIWVASDRHAHRGTPIGTDHVADALTIVKSSLKVGSEAFIDRENGHIILDALETRGFGNKIEKDRLQITQKGFIAGKILRKTSMLTSNSPFLEWKCLWWIVFISVLFLLAFQLLNSVSDFFTKIFSSPTMYSSQIKKRENVKFLTPVTNSVF